MKRLLILLLFFLVTGASVYLLTGRLQSTAEITDFLPVDTLFVVEWDDPGRWQGARLFPYDEKFDSTVGKIFPWLGFSDHLIQESKQHLDAFEKLSSEIFSRGLIARKGAFAILPVAPSSAAVPSPLSSHLVFALEIENDLSSRQFFQRYFADSAKQAILYQGEPLVTLVMQEGFSLTCWLQGNLLICAQEPALVQRCVDQGLQRKVRVRSGLQLSAGYRQLKKHDHDQADVMMYADLEGMRHWLPMFRDNDSAGGLLPHHLALFHITGRKENRLKFVAVAEKNSWLAFTSHNQLAPPVDEPAPLVIMRETGFSLWTNWLQLDKLWDFGLESSNMDVGALMTSVAQQLSEITGRPFATFFDVFGNGFGVFINEQAIPHQSNRSMGCLAIEVRNRPAVENLIKQLVANLQVITVKSGETDISSIVLAGGLLQPAYALVDNYLILADSVDLIEQARQQIRQYPNGRKTDQHQQGDRGGNLFVFIRTGDMAERLLPVFALLARDTGERTRMLSPENRLIVREFGLPLLASLRGIATSRLRGYAADDVILLEIDYSLRRE
jgi:hypothetical protein